MDPQNPYQTPPAPQPEPAAGFNQPVGDPSIQPNPPAPQVVPAAVNTSVNEFSVDYLNQIATPSRSKKISPLLLFGAIGGILALTAGVMFWLISASSPASASTQLYGLQARINTLKTVTAEQGKHLTQNSLSNINSTLGTTLTSMGSSLGIYMKSSGYTTAAPTIAAAEKSYYASLSQKLNDAYLTGTLDRTYTTEMTYQLGILKSKMQSVLAASSSKAYSDFYNTNITSVNTTAKLLSDFQSTK